MINIKKVFSIWLGLQASTLSAADTLPNFFDRISVSTGQSYENFQRDFESSGNYYRYVQVAPYAKIDLEKSLFNKKLNFGFEGSVVLPLETTVTKKGTNSITEVQSKIDNASLQLYFTGPYWTQYHISLGLGFQYSQFLMYVPSLLNNTFGTVPLAILKIGNHEISPHSMTLKAGINTRDVANNKDKFSPYAEALYYYHLKYFKNIDTALEARYFYSRTNDLLLGNNVRNNKHAISIGTQFTFK